MNPDQVPGERDGSFQIDGEKRFAGRLLASHPDLDDRVRKLVRSPWEGDPPPTSE